MKILMQSLHFIYNLAAHHTEADGKCYLSAFPSPCEKYNKKLAWYVNIEQVTQFARQVAVTKL